MISAKRLTKKYGTITALREINLDIPEGCVFGLVGSNGAGKSTFLRLTAGILRPDSGLITIDGTDPYEHPLTKRKFFYVSDDQYFLPNATPGDMMSFYANIYPAFDMSMYHSLMQSFGLPAGHKLHTYSKGMKKLLSLIYALSAGTAYILLDETFDGLDPLIRQTAKELIRSSTAEHALTAVISSHNLRELGDFCSHIGLLHNGGIVLSENISSMKLSIHKFQCVLPQGNPHAEDASSLTPGSKKEALLIPQDGTPITDADIVPICHKLPGSACSSPETSDTPLVSDNALCRQGLQGSPESSPETSDTRLTSDNAPGRQGLQGSPESSPETPDACPASDNALGRQELPGSACISPEPPDARSAPGPTTDNTPVCHDDTATAGKSPVLTGIDIIQQEQRGSVLILTARGNSAEIEAALHALNPIICEELPLTLEELTVHMLGTPSGQVH